ncbi:hypothetical protein FGA82_18370 [Pseudomonas fluorescens]|nr:hypothetical protein FGA82_18370 [Pseudomonas fluorescens]
MHSHPDIDERHKAIVGASLLAKGPYQPKSMLTDTSPSRASSLPQVLRTPRILLSTTKPL